MENLRRFYNHRERLKFRGSFNGVCVLVLLFFISVNNQGILQNPFSIKPYHPNLHPTSNPVGNSIPRRKIYENSTNLNSGRNHPTICTEIHRHKGYSSRCEYLKANPECNSGGFLNYLVFFYCDCQNLKPLGYIVLAIWLLALFYLLGNTAADYFCCSLEKLSSLLKLPPTVAGVTLLPLGNGAPDVFSSIAAFVGRDSGDVGLNSILGGAVFIICVVVGTVSLCVANRNIQIDKSCFLRDVGFFLIAIVSLLVILIGGEVSVGVAIAFVSIYVVYALFVGMSEVLRKHGRRLKLSYRYGIPLLPVVSSGGESDEGLDYAPLIRLGSDDDGVPHLRAKLPHWMWASNVAIYANEKMTVIDDGIADPLWGWNEREASFGDSSTFSCSVLYSWLEIPLAIPRRLTIPIVEEERWSKAYAVASAFFAPVLVSFLWCIGQDRLNYVYILAGIALGTLLGILAFFYTSYDHPPQKFLFPWVLGGFVMSIVWFYIIANELVALLATFGIILKIKPSLLALTILAWGNSMGDLMSNVAIAMNSVNGVQIAISGCYAGPMFNMVIGLGASMIIRAWSKKPAPYIIPRDWSLYYTLAVLVLGLVWALVVLPRNNMQPGKVLGLGLMGLYVGFLGVRATIAMGDGSLNDVST